MKKHPLFQTKIFIFLSCLLFIIPVAASAKQVTVSAYLDSDCDHHRGEIVVPQGFIATDFSAQIDSSWLPCAGPEPPSHIGYRICLFRGYEYGRAQYAEASHSYTLYKNRDWNESPAHLDKLVLPPGTYHVLVGGGKITNVEIKYNLITPGEAVILPSFDWEPVSSGGNGVDISDDQICIEAMKSGTGYATRKRPYDFTNDYNVSFDFKLNEKNNHWFILYSDSFLHVHIDWGTALHYIRPPNTKIMDMEVARWYHFKFDARPSKNSFDIYVDGKHVGTAINVKPGSVDVGSDHGTSGTNGAIGEWIYLGDAEKTSYNRGSGCWKNIMFSYTSAPPSEYHAVNHLSCKNNDNEEKGCCCFKEAHTYRFRAQYVSSVLARFDTGRKFNCRSEVQLQVDRGKGWETIKTVQAVSSSGDSELAPIDVEVPVNDTILGFRIFDGSVCCIDFSEIFLK